jgi:hypothetical protein
MKDAFSDKDNNEFQKKGYSVMLFYILMGKAAQDGDF